MIDLTDVFDRAETGPLTSDNDYYMNRFIPKLGELVTKYRIRYDPERILNTDDDLADRVFEAAIDLLAEAGAYCPDTNRVMEFTRDEILQAVTEAPKSTLFGEGREA
ncbi:MAG: monomethylamine:corrinoid methyltransferase, partial [bacterium]